jgi:hypothetical protein
VISNITTSRGTESSIEESIERYEAMQLSSPQATTGNNVDGTAKLRKFLLAQLSEYKPPKTHREMVQSTAVVNRFFLVCLLI